MNTGDLVKYVDFKDPTQFVQMPDWFEKISTIPGLPFGFVCEFVGQPDAGKSTAGIKALVAAQKQGFYAILVDAERKFSYPRFTAMGGDPTQLLVIAENSIEETFNALEIAERSIAQNDPESKTLVVFDSIAVQSTRSDLAKSTLDPQVMADQAKVLKRMLRRQVILLQETRVCLVCINQMYGNPNPAAHGAPSLSGGKGVEYAKAISIVFQRAGKLPPKTVAGVALDRGIITKISIKKNHLQLAPLPVTFALLHVTPDDMVIAPPKKKGKKGKDVVETTDGEEIELEETEAIDVLLNDEGESE
jgi:RecA/RadA recombinase